MSTATLPPPAEIRERIKLTREELSALMNLLRASEASSKADKARAKRSTPLSIGHSSTAMEVAQ